MRKIIIFLILGMSVFSATDLKKSINLPENQWVKVKFNLFKTKYLYEINLDREYDYQIVVSDKSDKIYDKPSTNLNCKIFGMDGKSYEKNIVFQGEGKVYIELTSSRRLGKAFIHITKKFIDPNRENIYDKVKDFSQIQDSNKGLIKIEK